MTPEASTSSSAACAVASCVGGWEVEVEESVVGAGGKIFLFCC